MKLQHKKKIEDLVQKIQSGVFDRFAVDNLLVYIRDYTKLESVLREISHFIVHPKKRDQGIVHEQMGYWCLYIKFYLEYFMAKRKLTFPMPSYVKDLLLLRLKKTDKIVIEQLLNISKDSIKNRIDKDLVRTKNKTILLHPSANTDMFEKIFKLLLSKFEVDSLFYVNGVVVVTDLMELFIKHKISYSREHLLYNKDKLVLCIMLLLHNTEYVNTVSVPQWKLQCNLDEYPNRITGSSVLCVWGEVHTDFKGDISICFPIIISDLLCSDWYERSLLSARIEGIDQINKGCYKMNVPLTISENFKLCNAY